MASPRDRGSTRRRAGPSPDAIRSWPPPSPDWRSAPSRPASSSWRRPASGALSQRTPTRAAPASASDAQPSPATTWTPPRATSRPPSAPNPRASRPIWASLGWQSAGAKRGGSGNTWSAPSRSIRVASKRTPAWPLSAARRPVPCPRPSKDAWQPWRGIPTTRGRSSTRPAGWQRRTVASKPGTCSIGRSSWWTALPPRFPPSWPQAPSSTLGGPRGR